MVNRTVTYFAFDGQGKKNPAESDFKYYSMVQAWAANENIEFKFTNSHDKASAVCDTSKRATLKASIMKRLCASKNMIVILSPQTRRSGSFLSFEIEKAATVYTLPLIIAYVKYESILQPSKLSNRWPNVLREHINNRTVNAIHIPFKKEAILDAINQFTVNTNKLNGPLNYYNKEKQIYWGYI